ncbi:MAG: AAA family ATPase [Gammaproteobacteria bacterium]|nr:AAA family ATPase [Gammaproteobacteria bacterium]
MFDENQRILIRSLLSLSVCPHDADRLQLIETHISWVFLCGSYAYKIKKALNLGFLDFSTLDKRKFYCEEELRLNGRLAPELYLAVVPITGTPDQPQLAGSGVAFEYAVKMRRFPQQAVLSHMLEQHLLADTHISQIIAQVADFHQTIPAATAATRYGNPDHVAAPVHENFVQIRDRMHDPRHLELLDQVRAWAEHQYESCYQHLGKRKEHGFIRECHGDMHLGNMAVVDDRVVIFDGIEFNPDLYWVDVMSEVAFLCMDLEYHGKGNFACRFLNGYLERTGDYLGLRVFRYYLAYRAMVRAKIACIRVSQQAGQSLQSSVMQEFERYLQLALSYTQPQQRALFITHGLSGSGKSTLSGPLVEPLAAIRIRSDRERQRMFGKGKRQGEAATIGEGAYSEDSTRQTYGKLAELAEAVLESGYSVIIDATFLERQQRKPFEQLADRLGVPIRILFFRADADVLRQRIRKRQHEGSDISEADLGVLEHQLAVYAGLDEDEQSYTVTIDTKSVSESAQILALVNQSLKQAFQSRVV